MSIYAITAMSPAIRLDRLVTCVAREIRLLEQALKTTNAKTPIEAYEQDDAALGELS